MTKIQINTDMEELGTSTIKIILYIPPVLHLGNKEALEVHT